MTLCNKIVIELLLPYLGPKDRLNLSLSNDIVKTYIDNLHYKYKCNYGYKLILSNNSYNILDRIFGELCIQSQIIEEEDEDDFTNYKYDNHLLSTEVFRLKLSLKDQIAFIKTSALFYKRYKKDLKYYKNYAFKYAYYDINDIVECRYRSGNGSMGRYWHYSKKEVYKNYGFKFTDYFWTDEESYKYKTLTDEENEDDCEFEIEF